MREIKFRAWDTEDKVMRTVTCVSWFDEYVEMDEHPNGEYTRRKLPEVVLLQYTGLHDKNGKEIYEGDVVLTSAIKEYPEDNNVYALIQKNHDGQWQTVQKGVSVGLPITWGGYKSLEIIGNIYENPELLK